MFPNRVVKDPSNESQAGFQNLGTINPNKDKGRDSDTDSDMSSGDSARNVRFPRPEKGAVSRIHFAVSHPREPAANAHTQNTPSPQFMTPSQSLAREHGAQPIVGLNPPLLKAREAEISPPMGNGPASSSSTRQRVGLGSDYTGEDKKKRKRAIPGWRQEGGKPAAWRCDSSGAGLVRRKGEKKSYNYGFQIPERALQNTYWGDAPEDLPPLGAPRPKKGKRSSSEGDNGGSTSQTRGRSV